MFEACPAPSTLLAFKLALQDRDHVSPGWGDPHLTSPPHLPTDTISSSDLEFEVDALSGGTLETTTQLKRDRKAEGLHHQGLGSEVHQVRLLGADSGLPTLPTHCGNLTCLLLQTSANA